MTEQQLRETAEGLPLPRRVLHHLGFFGHYLHVHAGGRSGKQHILTHLLVDGAMTQRELLDKCCISSAALSEVVAKLAAEGLVRRSKDEADQRTLLVELTDEGTARAEELLERKHDFEEQALACLDEGEREQLVDMLERMAAHWEQLDTRGGAA